MKKLFALNWVAALWAGISFSQDLRMDNPKQMPLKPALKHQGSAIDFSTYMSPKKPGHYTTEAWQALVDSLWGPGAPTETKLAVFDEFWSLVDQTWGGFPNLDVNWDSLKNVYRPIVEAGVSRGRFAGILSRLTRALQEWHAYVADRGIGVRIGLSSEAADYPNYWSFHYSAGVPLLMVNPAAFHSNFGAGLTPLSDGNILVYSVMPNHPLDLHPGDLILGYDGLPWMQQLDSLLKAELPIWVAHNLGSSRAAADHAARMSAGMNWGLFDTIDVVKYPANDTLHYPTSLLASIKPPYPIATEQLSVKGVPFPDIQTRKTVSWGIIKGTGIGYIYVWDWGGLVGDDLSMKLFSSAVEQLTHLNRLNGLILDFRTNCGGVPNYADGGYKHLFSFDPTTNFSNAVRTVGNDRYAFTISPGPPPFSGGFIPESGMFDRPIAVLLGPNCGSAGDYNAFRIRFHPMARTFGKPTNGAYTAGILGSNKRIDPFEWRIDDGCVYSNVNDEGYMIHKPFPVDEEIWLTREGVAKGVDDVVKRAIEWITTLTYAHDGTLSPHFALPGADTVLVAARLTNPWQHSAALSAVVTDSLGAVRDSVLLQDDGLHADGSAGDSLWAGSVHAPQDEGFFNVNVRVDDITQGTFRKLPMYFTTAGPVKLDKFDVIPQPPNYKLKPYWRNDGKALSIRGIKVSLLCADPWVDSVKSIPMNPMPGLAPGQRTARPSFTLMLNTAQSPRYFNVKVDFSIGGWVYWTDTMRVSVPGFPDSDVVDNREGLPVAFALHQNYPNPFNPVTTIRYAVPNRSKVTLTILNTLGQEVLQLADGEKEAGYHEVQLDGRNLESGIYFYRLEAGDFVQMKKFVLIK